MKRLATLPDVYHALTIGGFIRFKWATCEPELVIGANVRPLDGRTYHAIIGNTCGLVRSEYGTMEAKDLVIEWRKL